MSVKRLLFRLLVIFRRFVVSLGLGVTILAILLTVGYIFSGGWVASRLSQIVNQRLFIDRSTRLVVNRVTGSLFTRVVFDGVELDRRVGDSWSPSVRADRVEASYNLVGLLRGRRELAYLAVTGPRLDVAQDSSGAWVLPVGAIGRGAGQGSGGDIRVDRVLIRRGLLRLSTRDRGYQADSLDLSGSLEVKGSQVVIDVLAGAFAMAPPVGRIDGLVGQLRVDGRRVEARGARFDWEGSAVAADFSHDPADSLAGLRGDLRVERLPLGRLKGLVDTHLLPESGAVTGGVHVSGGRVGIDYRVRLSGRYGHHAVDTLSAEGRWEPGQLDFRSVRLATPLLDISDASGRFTLTRGQRLAADIALNFAELDSLPIKAVQWIKGGASGRVVLDLQNIRGGYGHTRGIVDADLGPSTAFGVALSDVRAHIDFDDGRDAQISGIELGLAGGGLVTGRGRVLPGTQVLDFTFEGESDDWAQLRPIVAVPGLAGGGQLAGRLIGTAARPELELSGTFFRAAGWDIRADSLTLVRLAGPFMPPTHLTGTLVAANLHGLGRVFDSVEMDYDWRDPRLTFSRLVAVDADTVIHTRGTADFDAARGSSHTLLTDGTLEMGGLTWVPEGPLTIEGLGQRYDVLPVTVRSPAGRTAVQALFQNDRGTMDCRFSAMDLDLVTLAGERKAPELKSGRMTGSLRLLGPNLMPDMSGQIGVTDYRWAEACLDSAGVDFATFGPAVRVNGAWAVSGPGRLTAAGTVGLPGPAWAVWNDWLGRRAVAWEKTRLSELTLHASDLDVARWAAWNPELKDVHGAGSGTLRLNGTVGAPVLTLAGALTRLRRGRDGVDSLNLDVGYAADSLHITRLHAARGGASLDLSGRVAVRLALYPPEGRLLELPIDLNVDLPRTDLSIFPFLGQQLDVANGYLAGHLRVKGTRRAPLAYGDLTLSDGRFRLKGREELFEQVYARARFDGATVHVDTLRARQGSDGRLDGHGTFELGDAPTSAYRLTIDAKRLVVRQSGDYAVQFDGTFDVTPLTLSGGAVRPMTTGALLVSRAEIVRSLNRPQVTPEPGQDFYFRIGIDAPGRVFVVNDLVDMELRGNLTASKTPEGTALTGDLEILKGYYSLLYRRFRITSGTLTFDKLDVIDPQIDITAETNAPDHTYRILLTGRASQPVIHFEAEPADLSEEEILNRLAPGATLVNQEGGLDRGQAAALGVNVLSSSVQALLQRVQRELAGKLGIIDELRLDAPSATDRNAYARITAARYLTPEINVSYSQGLGGSLEQGLSAEYRLGRLLFLHGEFIRRRPTSDDPRGEEYNLDLQFFHEY